MASPIPIPPIKRQTAKSHIPLAKAEPKVETMKNSAASIMVFLRPRRSVNHMPNRGPDTEPSIALLTANPFRAGESPKSFSRNGSAPAMITRSKPNMKPPIEAIRTIRYVYTLFPWSVLPGRIASIFIADV